MGRGSAAGRLRRARGAAGGSRRLSYHQIETCPDAHYEDDDEYDHDRDRRNSGPVSCPGRST